MASTWLHCYGAHGNLWDDLTIVMTRVSLWPQAVVRSTESSSLQLGKEPCG